MEFRNNPNFCESDDLFCPGPDSIIDDKYRIKRLVTKGGMGSIYEATQVSIGRQVAIKILHGNYANDRIMIDRFHREAKAVSAIGHDNICEVTDFGLINNNTPYLVMPLLKGLSLADVLISQKIHINQFQDVVGQILVAIQAVHNSHIIHRDLKPENVFITKIGDRANFVKLLDFGISKFYERSTSASSRLTDTGYVLGTAFYMAPEQATGSRWIDHRVDIYAVGVILYEALTGCLPFVGESYNEVIHRIATSPLMSPRAINPNIPKNMEQIIIKSMQRDPAARFASADALRHELETIENGDFYLPNGFEPTSREHDTSRVNTNEWHTEIEGPQSDIRVGRPNPQPHFEANGTVFRISRPLLVLVVCGTAIVVVLALLHFLRTPLSKSRETRKKDEIQTGSPVISKPDETPQKPSTIPVRKMSVKVEQKPETNEKPDGLKNTSALTIHKENVVKRSGNRRSSRAKRDQTRSIEQAKESAIVSEKNRKKSESKAIQGRFGTVIYSEYE